MKDLNTCFYSPGTDKHECCTHTQYCIFNQNRTELETQITQLENQITDFKKIKEAAINGEVIYHKGLQDFYNMTSSEYIGLDGKIHHKFSVSYSEKFINALNNKIINLEYDLKNLEYYRMDILHGKIGGYGYGNQ
jgi:hypothetical protein